MRGAYVVVCAVVLLVCACAADGKEKYEEMTELEFQASKTRLAGEKIALLTYMGDLMDVTTKEIPDTKSNTVVRAIYAMTHRKLVKFVIPETKDLEKTLELFYMLSPGSPGRPGSRITIYGKVVKTSDKEVFILVGRDGAAAIEEGWPDHLSPCPTCGRPGYAKAPKPPKKKKKRK
jgi:hypothetical protein